MVLYFNFSMVNKAPDKVQEDFNKYCNIEIGTFLDNYRDADVFHHDIEQTVTLMKKWYNNYRFSKECAVEVFNTDAVLYYMMKSYDSKYQLHSLIDDNLRMDYSKLRHLIQTDRRQQTRLNGNFEVLKTILQENGIAAQVKSSFPLEQLTDRENFISLLYYFGLLTYSGHIERGQPFLTIPNETIRTMIYEYLRASLNDAGAFAVDIFNLQDKIQSLAYDGELRPVVEFIADEIKRQTSVRDYIQGEKVIQTFFLAYLNILDFYISLSEEERAKGYADIVLKPFFYKYADIPYSWLLEFKYIPRSEDPAKLQQLLDAKLTGARQQLAKYSHDDFSKRMLGLPPYGEVKLRTGVVVFNGWELVHLEETDG